jgi:hypothetical protein
MLIYHSISAFELLHRTLTLSEKREIFEVFQEVGIRMGIADLPKNFENWEVKRKENLSENYQKTELSTKLFEAYKTHLGSIRFQLLLYVQKILLPTELKTLAGNLPTPNLDILMYYYNCTKTYWPIHRLKYYLLPKQYRNALKDLFRN